MEYMMDNKSTLIKFRRFEIIESTLSDNRHIKVEINKDISRKRAVIWEISNTLLHNL